MKTNASNPRKSLVLVIFKQICVNECFLHLADCLWLPRCEAAWSCQPWCSRSWQSLSIKLIGLDSKKHQCDRGLYLLKRLLLCYEIFFIRCPVQKQRAINLCFSFGRLWGSCWHWIMSTLCKLIATTLCGERQVGFQTNPLHCIRP